MTCLLPGEKSGGIAGKRSSVILGSQLGWLIRAKSKSSGKRLRPTSQIPLLSLCSFEVARIFTLSISRYASGNHLYRERFERISGLNMTGYPPTTGIRVCAHRAEKALEIYGRRVSGN